MKVIEKAAKQAVEVCLGIKKGEKVIIITDRETLKIGSAVKDAVEKITDNVCFFVMEDFGPRPLALPKEIAKALKIFDIGFFIIQDIKGESAIFRGPMIDIIEQNPRSRYAHMGGINESIFRGLCCDYKEIGRFSELVHKKVYRAQKIEVQTKAGTNLTFQFSSKIKWVVCSGIMTPGSWHNLPEGEVFTCPGEVNGRLVVDGCLGDFFDYKYGLLKKTPVSMQIQNSRAVPNTIECADSELKAELTDYLFNNCENSDRVGEFAFGTNIGIKKLVGNLLQDEKFQGIHLAFGDSYPKETGAKWGSDSHIDCVIQKPTVYVDGKMIMRKGKYLNI